VASILVAERSSRASEKLALDRPEAPTTSKLQLNFYARRIVSSAAAVLLIGLVSPTCIDSISEGIFPSPKKLASAAKLNPTIRRCNLN